MTYKRAVQLYDPVRQKGGTGFFITDRLILTARHVVADNDQLAQATYDLRIWGHFKEGEDLDWIDQGCSLCKALKRDLALLKLNDDQPAMSFPENATISFAKLSPENTFPASGTGFPIVQRYNNKQSPEPLEGQLSSLAGLGEGQLRLQVSSMNPDKPEDWQGISGTALLVEGYLVGVVTETNKGFRERALWAEPVSHITDDPDFCHLVNGESDISVEIVDLPQQAEDRRSIIPEQLKPKQMKDLQNALIAAFPEIDELEILVQYSLGNPLNRISRANTYDKLVFDLLKWVNARGKVVTLINAAIEANPDSPELLNFMDSL